MALALQQRGMGTVRVYERDGDFHTRSQGYGLTLQQGAVAVRALGILDEAKRAGVSSRAHLCLDATSARELGRHGSGVEARRGGQNRQNKGQNEDDGQDGSPRRGNVHLPRQALRALLCGGLDDGIVRWGCELTNVAWAEEGSVAQGANSLAQGCSIEPSTAPPELIFNGGRLRVRANLVVGADGIRSATRRLLLQQREASLELRHSVEGVHSVEEGHSSRVAELTPLEPLGVMVILGFAPCSTRHSPQITTRTLSSSSMVSRDSMRCPSNASPRGRSKHVAALLSMRAQRCQGARARGRRRPSRRGSPAVYELVEPGARAPRCDRRHRRERLSHLRPRSRKREGCPWRSATVGRGSGVDRRRRAPDGAIQGSGG